MTRADRFLSLLQKSVTQELHDGDKLFKITFGQLNDKTYIVLYGHPNLKSFGIFQSVSIDEIEKLLS